DRTHHATRAEQTFHRRCAERDHDARLNDVDLLNEITDAGLHFLGRRWTISGRAFRHVGTAFQNICDVNLVAAKAHCFDDASEQLTGPAHKRIAARIFTHARCFSDEPHLCTSITDPKATLAESPREVRSPRD